MKTTKYILFALALVSMSVIADETVKFKCPHCGKLVGETVYAIPENKPAIPAPAAKPAPAPAVKPAPAPAKPAPAPVKPIPAPTVKPAAPAVKPAAPAAKPVTPPPAKPATPAPAKVPAPVAKPVVKPAAPAPKPVFIGTANTLIGKLANGRKLKDISKFNGVTGGGCIAGGRKFDRAEIVKAADGSKLNVFFISNSDPYVKIVQVEVTSDANGNVYGKAIDARYRLYEGKSFDLKTEDFSKLMQMKVATSPAIAGYGVTDVSFE